MIVKLQDSNIQEIIKYLDVELSKLEIVKNQGGLSKRVFIDLKSNGIKLDYEEGNIELIGISRIDGNPMFNLFNVSSEAFLSARKNRINFLLDENVNINNFLLTFRNPKLSLIQALEDHKYTAQYTNKIF